MPPVLRERAWSMRKKRSNTRSSSSPRDADALVGDRDLDDAVDDLRPRRRRGRPRGEYCDRVRDQVVHGDDQQRPSP